MKNPEPREPIHWPDLQRIDSLRVVDPGALQAHTWIGKDFPSASGGWRPWETWTDKASGEVVESYTMRTLNVNAHPLLSRMHKPNPALGSDERDKRSVVNCAEDNAKSFVPPVVLRLAWQATARG